MISMARNEIAFVKAEATFGTANMPVAADVVYLVGEGKCTQQQANLKDEQRRQSISRLGQIEGVYPPGEWSITCYIKPSGALGTAPRPGSLLKAVFGIETVNGAASVVYTLGGVDLAMVGHTIVIKKGNVVFWNIGSIVPKMSNSFKAGTGQDALWTATFSGEFCKQYWAGESTATEIEPIAETELKVDDPFAFTAGALIEHKVVSTGVWDNNAGVGYAISSVNTTTGYLTIPALVAATEVGDVVRGFIPTPSDAGTAVHCRFGNTQVDYAGGLEDFLITGGGIEINNNFKLIPDEKTNDKYPITPYKAGEREIDITLEKVFKDTDGKIITHADLLTQIDVDIPMGGTAAYRGHYDIPKFEANTPDISGSEEHRMTINGMAVASAALDDELSLIFD